MQLKVRRIGNGYGVLFPKQLLDEMNLSENSTLNVSKVDGMFQLIPFVEEFTAQVEAFLQAEAAHRNAYRELANERYFRSGRRSAQCAEPPYRALRRHRGCA